MIEFRTTTVVPADRQVVIHLPPETPVGDAELVVRIAPRQEAAPVRGGLRLRFGSVRGGDRRAADNERIDVDLARSYGNSHQ